MPIKWLTLIQIVAMIDCGWEIRYRKQREVHVLDFPRPVACVSLSLRLTQSRAMQRRYVSGDKSDNLFMSLLTLPHHILAGPSLPTADESKSIQVEPSGYNTVGAG